MALPRALSRLVWRDVSVRYKQTFLGVAWAILVPVFTAAVYVVIFGKFAQFPAGEKNTAYPSLVLAGCCDAVLRLGAHWVEHEPRLQPAARDEGLLPANAAAARLGDRASRRLPRRASGAHRADVVLRPWPNGPKVLLAPLFILLAMVTVLGLGFLFSAVNVRYRDVRYMIPVFLQVLPLLSGVMYAVEAIPTKWQWVLAFPMTAVIAGLALGGARRGDAQRRSDRDRRRRRARAVRRRPRRLPFLRARFADTI